MQRALNLKKIQPKMERNPHSAKKSRKKFVEDLQVETPKKEGSSNDIKKYLINGVKEIVAGIPALLAERCHTLNQTQDLSDRKKLLEQIDKIYDLPERLNKHLKIAKGSKDSEERKASIEYLKKKISLYERIKSQGGAGR